MNIKTTLIFFFVLGCLASYPAWSDVEIDIKSADKTLLEISLTKAITAEDYSKIIKLTNLTKRMIGQKPAVVIKLNSSGGSISTSLKIGRYLRQHDSMAVVFEDAICFSSCVYVLAGATNRIVTGQVGIHRPYEPDGNVTSASVQKAKYQKLGTQIVAYLKEMNIPTRLYEDSLFISPDEIKILSFAEMQAYGLNVNDPYSEEARDTSKAKSYGISRKEFAIRSARSLDECGLDNTFGDLSIDDQVERLECRDDVLKGTR